MGQKHDDIKEPNIFLIILWTFSYLKGAFYPFGPKMAAAFASHCLCFPVWMKMVSNGEGYGL